MRAALKRNAKTFAIILIYLSVGCLFYTQVEEKDCESQAPVTVAGCKEPWTLIDALYFSMVTMSTVGFGDFKPGSPGSRVFTCFYIIIGISVVFVQVAERLSGLVNYLEGLVVRCIMRRSGNRGKRVMDIDGDGQADLVLPSGAVVYWCSNLAFPVVVIVGFQILFAAMFVKTEPGLTFWDAFYHCLVTSTTVGYGDIALTTQASRLWAIVHIAASVSWLAALISEVPARKAERALQLQKVALLHRQLDPELITSLDKDGTGVDKLEFVIGMLIELNAEMCGQTLTWADVRPFVSQFEAADMDKSGRLSQSDLELMVRKKREQLGEKHAQKLDQHFAQSLHDNSAHVKAHPPILLA
mmetsp:Transcript_29745/g.67355  ORF Transcript_29745/g.67355 Transcript_29745/m.67355 type:complete len:356 (-) Transcript_29745:177-1244(-)